MNLLPPKEKIENQRNYFYRFLAGLTGAVLASLLLGCGLLLPSYILIKAKQAELKANLVSLKNLRQADGGEKVYKILEAADQRVDFLLFQPAPSLTAAVKEILVRRPAGVKITGLTYHPQADAAGRSVAMALTGVAASREAIVAFVKELQTEPSFSSINVPVSSFAKGRNIEFSLTLVQNEK
ncbi:MAG: hypothetical protein A3D52_02140 [Candidatus Taylorbacteria bacterium RIFCSPHIGHO2_02_FULL_44_36]|uniref:Uncharacterized protein n=1 Tax=Candidatus Taylorbacteria bacterium RIFCSPLOWO2_12_FULL_44_15c TaxID=1802333 RepID=A0A1G2P6R9_9BACT|nr:MAG: hypothetical protein A3D52_02140 [Candidatus Taylorbacteria bacterium RIFCSPHIGHO2_02_FULL_44_36]OHA38322.1 MAG: hypothetical protein A3I97_02265 [Candidatus Taylorbacteria bacterium RIFCSPLOWO2_02_FULL_44_35]OHA44046.1 MAG: hypothetical protein A3G03_00630 [Candidatus Taylorbacteria bacterium RIFCSPLOWO2_12_FULL_44_15c]